MLNGYPLSPWALEDELDGDIEECLERAYDTKNEDDEEEEEELSVYQLSIDAGVY